MLAQKKQEINNSQAQLVENSLQAIDNPISKGSSYQGYCRALDSYSVQDPFSSQDPFDEALKLLAFVAAIEPTNSRLEKDSNVISIL